MNKTYFRLYLVLNNMASSACMCMCVWVCVWERERESCRLDLIILGIDIATWQCVCVCMIKWEKRCVCACEFVWLREKKTKFPIEGFAILCDWKWNKKNWFLIYFLNILKCDKCHTCSWRPFYIFWCASDSIESLLTLTDGTQPVSQWLI